MRVSRHRVGGAVYFAVSGGLKLDKSECWLQLGRSLSELAADQGEWSQATFGSDEQKGPIGAMRHLAKECGEAEDWWKQLESAASYNDSEAMCKYRKEIGKEFADMLILWLDARRRAGFEVQEVVDYAIAKMAENKVRKWPAIRVGDDPVEHVREG